MQKDIGYILVTLGSAQEFALYLASMQTAGSCLIHLEPKNFTLCDPQQTSIQHVNINFTLQKLQSQGALQRKSFACSVPSHGILPKDTLRAGLESIRGLGNRQHTGGGGIIRALRLGWIIPGIVWILFIFIDLFLGGTVVRQSPPIALLSGIVCPISRHSTRLRPVVVAIIPHSTISFRQRRICPFGFGLGRHIGSLKGTRTMPLTAVQAHSPPIAIGDLQSQSIRGWRYDR